MEGFWHGRIKNVKVNKIQAPAESVRR